METIFIGGSIEIKRLDTKVVKILTDIVKKGFHIVVGDAPGVDKEVQDFLGRSGYRNGRLFDARGNAVHTIRKSHDVLALIETMPTEDRKNLEKKIGLRAHLQSIHSHTDRQAV
jgi:hypothetical protein